MGLAPGIFLITWQAAFDGPPWFDELDWYFVVDDGDELLFFGVCGCNGVRLSATTIQGCLKIAQGAGWIIDKNPSQQSNSFLLPLLYFLGHIPIASATTYLGTLLWLPSCWRNMKELSSFSIFCISIFKRFLIKYFPVCLCIQNMFHQISDGLKALLSWTLP